MVGAGALVAASVSPSAKKLIGITPKTPKIPKTPKRTVLETRRKMAKLLLTIKGKMLPRQTMTKTLKRETAIVI